MIVPTAIFSIKAYVFHRKGDTITTRSWSDLKGKRIGIIRGEIYAEKATKGMNVEKVTNYRQLFHLLRIHRIDQTVGFSTPASRALAIDPESDQISRLPVPIFKAPIYHLLHKKNARLVAPLDRVLRAMAEDGRLKQSQNRALEDLLVISKKPAE